MSGHWYASTGELVLGVPGSKGGTVKPDLRHARKLQLAPGCTTIIKSANRDALNVWREKQVLMAALTLPRLPDETDEAFIGRVMADSAKQAEQAAEKGTEIHARVEHGINLESEDPWVCAVQEQLGVHYPEAVENGSWRTELPCVSLMGYATKSDLSLDGEKGVVIDIKTKDGDLSDARLYDEHLMQLAATRSALGLPNAECGILFVGRENADAWYVVATEEEVQRGFRMFLCLLKYWQEKNKYRPSWAVEVML